MPLTEEQVTEVKQQLLTQLDNFPEEKRDQMKKQIESMSNEDVENFVKQNQLNHLPGGCVFCAIAEGKMPSYKIGENEENMAVLEINPLSKGHTLIIPKKHDTGILPSTKKLAEEIEEEIKKIYTPKEVQTTENKITDHIVLELTPIYGDETKRSKASEEELRKIQEDFFKDSEPPKEEIGEKSEEKEIPKLRRRIP